MKRILLIFVSAALLFSLVRSACAQSTPVETDSGTPKGTALLTPNDSARIVVTVERRVEEDGRATDTLDVFVKSSGADFAGFDFKLGLDGRLAAILDVIPGAMIDSCGWDFFHTSPVRSAGLEGRPPHLWQVVALANSNPSDGDPACFGSDGSLAVFRIVLTSSGAEVLPDTSLPVFFYWEDCTDNTMSDITGNLVFVSDAVYDYSNTREAMSSEVFPTRLGAPKQCFGPKSEGRVFRIVEYHNGGVEFRLGLGKPLDPNTTAPEAPLLDGGR